MFRSFLGRNTKTSFYDLRVILNKAVVYLRKLKNRIFNGRFRVTSLFFVSVGPVPDFIGASDHLRGSEREENQIRNSRQRKSVDIFCESKKEEPTTASRNRYIHTCAPQDRGFSTWPEHAGSNERTLSWVTGRFSQQSRALQASLSGIMRSTAHISEASLGSDGRFNQILCEVSFTIKALFQKSLRFTKKETVRIQPMQKTTDQVLRNKKKVV